jgi:hypothetical protein
MNQQNLLIKGQFTRYARNIKPSQAKVYEILG